MEEKNQASAAIDLNNKENLKKTIESYLLQFRESVIASFESLENSIRFTRTPWKYQKGEGGGEMGVIRGDTFEKAAVHYSKVSGKDFYATGVSLITHMSNPKMPTVHMNIRYMEKNDKSWFGGGYDLTPMGFEVDEDTSHFHNTARNALGDATYKHFSAWAKEYFFITHRNKERGVGGIFFDDLNTGNINEDFSVWQSVGESFLPAIMPIYEKNKEMPFTEEDKQTQLVHRGHYAEFNLVYDRGTKYGFESGGNTEAILSSMPPLAKW